MIKKFIIAFILIFEISMYSQNNNTKQIYFPDIQQYNNILKEWIQCYSLDLNQFQFASKKSGFYHYNNVNDCKEIYLPFVRFSADQTKYLDATSYSLFFTRDKNNRIICESEAVDSEVSVRDIFNNTLTRLVFGGSTTSFDDAFWIDNEHCIVVGYSSDTDKHNNTFIYPTIWFIDIGQEISYLYAYNQPVPANKLSCKYFNIKYPNVIFADYLLNK